MKSRCNSCRVLSSPSKSPSLHSNLSNLNDTRKPRIVKKKYLITRDPAEQSRKKNADSITEIESKYLMFKDHVMKKQGNLLKEVVSARGLIHQLQSDLREKESLARENQVLVKELNLALKQEGQAKINLQVELIQARNQINVLKKENEFYSNKREEVEEYRQEDDRRRKEIAILKEAFGAMKAEVLLLRQFVEEA